MLDNIASGKSSKLALNQADMYSDLASLRQQLLSSSMCSPVSPATAQAASTAVQTLSYQECQLLLSVNPLRDDQLDLLTLIKLWNLSLSVVKKRIESNHLLERSQAGTVPRYLNVRLVGEVFVLIYDMFLCVSAAGSQLIEDAPILTNLLDAHQSRLSALSAFNNSLNEELPALQEQTTELRKLFPPEPSTTGKPADIVHVTAVILIRLYHVLQFLPRLLADHWDCKPPREGAPTPGTFALHYHVDCAHH